jgi:alpha-galactosidase
VLPGAFVADKNSFVAGTTTTIGSLFNLTVDGRPGISNQYNLRNSFNYGNPAQQADIQAWHDSVVELFASWYVYLESPTSFQANSNLLRGVEMIKLDYMTPGSDVDPNVKGSNILPADSSGSVIAYHNSIQKIGTNIFGRKMRLDISWRLDFDDDQYFQIWKANADSLRVDRDINAANTPVTFGAIQRTVERYRRFINQQVLNNTRVGQGINIRPDMDNLYVGNPAGDHDLSALTDTQRYTQAIFWIGAGANLITGSDLRPGRLDALGSKLLFDDEPQFAASFTSQWPMQPRNPDDAPTPGGPDPRQLQAWISGPNEEGTAYVILTNLGEDQCWDSECSYSTEIHGVQLVSISLANLGIGGSSWFVRRVLGGGGSGGPDYTDIGVTTESMASNLDHYESALYKLQKCGTAGAGC